MKAALRLMLALAALAAGEATAARVEVAAPRVAIVQWVRVEARQQEVAQQRSRVRPVAAPSVEVPRSIERAAAVRERKLYLLHRALLH